MMAIFSFTHTHTPMMTNWTALTIVCESYSLSDCSVGGSAGFYFSFLLWLLLEHDSFKKKPFLNWKEERRTWWFWSAVRGVRRRRLALIDNDAPKRLDQISSISGQGLSGAFVMCLYRRHGRRSAESADAPNSIDTSKILREREREKSPGKERSKAGRRTCADRCCLCVCVARLLFNS